MKLAWFSAIALVFLFSNISLAAPFLHDQQPANNSYISGGAKIFSINVTDPNFNTSSATVYIISLIAYLQGENWDTHAMSCEGSGSEWNCTKSISFAIAGSDTIELLYFSASDTSGTTGYYGNSTSPLNFTLDRTPPAISFSSPINGSYVGGSKTISISVADSSSGVNNNTVQFSPDQSQWTNMSNSTQGTFNGIWDTTALSNNQTVTLYVRASDMVNNTGTANVNVSIDNEIPRLTVLSSLSGTQRGSIALAANVSDSFSGVASVVYNVGTIAGTLGCTGSIYNYACSAVLNTANLADGNYTLNFTVNDKAGNSNTTSVPFESYNMQPSISISEPGKNSFLSGSILVMASLANSADVTYVELNLSSTQTLLLQNMTCNLNFTSCNYTLNTTAFSDGGYTIKAKVANKFDLDVSASTAVTFDNTKPVMNILKPLSNVGGDFYIDVGITETNLNTSSVKFELGSATGNLMCTPQTPSQYICSTAYDSKKIGDGKYTLKVTAVDKAGNAATELKEINILNKVGSGSSGSSASGSSAGGKADTSTENPEKTNESPIIPFKSEYVMIGVIVAAVIFVIIILALVAVHKLGKPIITE
ncbi:MAG: hypothetical protein HYT70_00235 [Candidatus Aenigmarchaeota archaeon]|nr:hypothetical protein [Candidatus Aenigmarchaeota archaeon]